MPRIIGVNTGLVIAGEQPEGFVPKRKIVMVDEEAKNAAYRDTKRHIAKVRHFLLKISDELNTRSLDHDASKLEEPRAVALRRVGAEAQRDGVRLRRIQKLPSSRWASRWSTTTSTTGTTPSITVPASRA